MTRVVYRPSDYEAALLALVATNPEDVERAAREMGTSFYEAAGRLEDAFRAIGESFARDWEAIHSEVPHGRVR